MWKPCKLVSFFKPFMMLFFWVKGELKRRYNVNIEKYFVTCTGPEIRHESVAFAAAALVAALRVGAVGLTASIHNGTFINICNQRSQLVYPFTILNEKCLKITNTPLTDAALPIRCCLVTGVAGALVGSWQVDTLAVLAQVVTQLALVHIWSDKQISRIKQCT